MPHLFVNRPRVHQLREGKENAPIHFTWETMNAICYGVGGLMFVVGSVFFFPRYGNYLDVGLWLFFVGSLLFLLVNIHDIMEIHVHATAERLRELEIYRKKRTMQTKLEIVAGTIYLCGTLLFVVGSFLFLSFVNKVVAATFCFIIGSLAFAAGASINVLQSVYKTTLLQLQLTNITAISFIIGSILFTVASVPYLWSNTDSTILYDYLAWQFVIGSGFFLFGGIANYGRAKTAVILLLEQVEAGAIMNGDNMYHDGRLEPKQNSMPSFPRSQLEQSSP